MAATVCSIHCYTGEPVCLPGERFQCFSEGWQTYLPPRWTFDDPDVTWKAARRISRAVEAPVLWFYLFDEDELWLEVYVNGKKIAGCGESRCHIDRIPELTGMDENARRLSRILRCTDMEQKIAMLEEYFGVALMLLYEEEDADAWRRSRGDVLYRQYEAAEKRLTGKFAAVRAELVQELPGVWQTWDRDFRFITVRVPDCPDFKPGYGIYRCANTTDAEPVPVCFRDGRLEFITEAEMRCRGIAEYPFAPVRTVCWTEQGKQVCFTAEAPAAYAGQCLTLPAGWTVLGFADGCLLLQAGNSIAVLDETQKIIAKLRLKGQIAAQNGPDLLTVQERGAEGTLRVYRIRDNRKGKKI